MSKLLYMSFSWWWWRMFVLNKCRPNQFPSFNSIPIMKS